MDNIVCYNVLKTQFSITIVIIQSVLKKINQLYYDAWFTQIKIFSELANQLTFQQGESRNLRKQT